MGSHALWHLAKKFTKKISIRTECYAICTPISNHTLACQKLHMKIPLSQSTKIIIRLDPDFADILLQSKATEVESFAKTTKNAHGAHYQLWTPKGATECWAYARSLCCVTCFIVFFLLLQYIYMNFDTLVLSSNTFWNNEGDV